MSDLSEEETEGLEKWISDWKQEFATDYSRSEIDTWIGKKVLLSREDEQDKYEFTVVGSSETFVKTSGEEFAVQLAIVTLDGKMIHLRPGVVVEEIGE